MRSRFSQTTPESETLAPVIDIKTRERIASWSQRYANDVDATDDGLSTMATDLNSHIFSYTGQSGQSPTDRMYKGMGGADLDNQPQLSSLRSKYNDSSPGSIGKAVQQIKLFTGKDSYGSDIRTNREKFPEFHGLMDQASPIAGGLSRGTVLTDVRHGTSGSPIDISQHYKVGDKMITKVTSATSDPNLAKSWVLDDKQRFDKAKNTGDNSVLDTKYNGARHGAFVVQHFPAGIKGLQVAPLSAVPEHNEVVPQAGQKLRVSKVTGPDESGVHHVYYEHDTERVASWNERYATTVRPDKCRLCGQSDDGTRTIVSNGTCKDTQECAETQEGLANRTLTVLEPVKKPRKKPIVDRKGTAACTHPDCLEAGKRYPATSLSWDKSPMGNPVCRDHWRPGTTDYNSWKGEYKRR
jgi:hypothetical protein